MNLEDIVRVKDYMVEGYSDGIYYNDKMDIYKGKTYRIIKTIPHGSHFLFTLGNLDKRKDSDLDSWKWIEKWLDPVNTRVSIEELL